MGQVRQRSEMGQARKFTQRTAPSFAIWLGVAAFVIAVAAPPAEAKKKRPPVEKSAEQTIPDPANDEPMTLVVSLRDQKIDVYRGTTLITNSKVSSGMSGYATEAGVFSILEKQRFHHSNIYSGAPMPWMLRLTWSGIALHGGVVPGYRASHGCIRLPFSFAPKLFQAATVGDNVVIAHDRVVPKLIEHSALLQPLVAPALPEPVAALGPEHPSTESSPGQAEAPNNVHAIDPLASASSEPSSDVVMAAPSPTPLRMLVTRRTQRDRIIGVQHLLASMGYLRPQNFSGRLGKETLSAIKAFQKANGMPETGTFTDNLAKKVYQVAGKDELEGHLFVRQDFRRVFDMPIAFRNPEQTLGTHVFIALKFDPSDTRTQWIAISLEGDAAATLDRIEIPTDVRQKISEKLTPGSSLIIGDKSINSAILPDGGDFLVSVKETPAVAERTRAKHANVKKAKAKQTKAMTRRRIEQKPWTEQSWERAARRYSYDHPRRFRRSRQFSRW
jgi:peptidoglycan hydrolase-like protein with peptidoglycan-binding domain